MSAFVFPPFGCLLIKRIEEIIKFLNNFKNLELRSRLSMVVQVKVVLNRNVAVDSDSRFDNLCGSHLQSRSELYHVS